MRLFIAIPLPQPVVAELTRLTARLRPSADDLRWSAPEAWHITLQFLGNTSEEQYACLVPRLSALKSAPVSIGFEGLGVFDRAGVFYLGVTPGPALVALQKKVVAATESCEFVPEDRPFRPHITLARSKGQARTRELRALIERAGSQLRFANFTAAEVLLYESHLSPAGSRYEVKCRFPLSKPSPQNAD